MPAKRINEEHPPWYRQFWPWVLIAIPLLTVVASGITFWLALSHPDTLVVDEARYQHIRNELKAQDVPDSNSGNSAAEKEDGQP